MKPRLQIVYFILILGILIALGFIGYYFGFLNFIYNIMIPNTFSKYNIIILSIIFGIAAFFSPCAFTVLPSYVANFIEKNRVGSSLYYGTLAAVGVMIVNIVIGLVIALLGEATPFAKDPRQDIPIILTIRMLAGVFILILGILTLMEKTLNFHFIQNYISRFNVKQNMFMYGIFYNGAAIGCTGPILLALILYAYASGSFFTAFTAFIVFSITMGSLMIILSLLVGLFKQSVIRRLAITSIIIKKVASIIMIIVGLSIILLTLEGNNLFVKIFFPYLK